MALLFMDSFDHYVTADIAEKWTSVTNGFFGTATINSSAGRRSSGGFRFSDTGGNGNAYGELRKTLTPADTTGIMGFSVTMPAGAPHGTNGTAFAAFRDGSTIQVCLKINTDRTLSAVRGTAQSGTVLGTSSATLTTSNSYVEFKVVIHASAGTVDVRINGTSVLSLTSQNTRNTANTQWNVAQIGIPGDAFACWSGTVANVDFDDFYVLDGSGSSPWNAFLGDCRVDPRYPTAAGATTGFTPSTGSNWQNVDDTSPDDDSTYNSAAAVATDTFTVQDAPVAGAVVYGVQHCLAVKKSDAGTCTVAAVVRHSSTDYVGADGSPGTSYSYLLTAQQVNPGTSAQWTESNFNAAEFGYKRTA